MTPPPSGQSSWAWCTTLVALVGVHGGLLEAERDEEVDHRRGVAGLEGAPHGGGGCVVAHAPQSGRLRCPPSWMFRRSSASHVVGGAAHHPPELAGQVALVGVTRSGGDLGEGLLPRGEPADQRGRTGSSRHSCLGESPSSATVRVRSWRGLSCDLAGHVLDPAAAVARRRPAARRATPRVARRTPRRRSDPRAHPCLHDVEPALVGLRLPTRSCSSRAARPSTSWPWSPGPCQLAGPAPEERLRGERVDGELDAGLVGRLLDPGRDRVQARHASRRTTSRRSGSNRSPSATVPETRTGPSTETMKVIQGDGQPAVLAVRDAVGLVGDRRGHRAGQEVVPVLEAS